MTVGGHSSSLFRREVVPFLATFAAEATAVGITIFYKAAVVDGLSYQVFMAYCYAISAVVTLPLAFFCHRKQELPPFTIGLFCKFFLLGIIGFAWQSCAYKGIELSSPTLGSALSNLNPATTFFLAILLRIEKLKLRSLSSQAKIIGTLVSIAGALVVVLYEGPLVINTHPVMPRQPVSSSMSAMSTQKLNWIIGGGLLAISFVFLSISDILQTKFLKEYPAEFTLVFWLNLSAFIITLPVAVIAQPDITAWKMSFGVKLVAILYSGVIGSALSPLLHAWGLRVKGPVYVTMFKPMSIVIAAISGIVFLGDNLYLGCVVGSLIISVGFYAVIWGKSKDYDDESEDYNIGSTRSTIPSGDGKVPLLKYYVVPVEKDSWSVQIMSDE